MMPLSAGLLLTGNTTGTIESMASGFTGLATLVTNAFNTITSADILAACFAAGLLGIGFRVIRQAKRF